MTILDKNTITLPNAQETYPNIVESVNEGLFYYTIPITMAVIGVIVFIAGIILQFKIDREEERDLLRSVTPFFLMTSFFIFIGVASLIMAILTHKLEKDTTLMAEHVSQHPETEDNITALANTIGFDYKEIGRAHV